MWVSTQVDLTTTLVQQCHQSEHTIQRIIESSGDDEALLFEALSINDEIQKVLSKFGDMKANTIVPTVPRHDMIPITVEPDETPREGKEDSLIRKPSSSSGGTQVKNNDDEMDDLDEMIFGKKTDGTSETGHATKKESTKDDLINF
ncbi:GAT domain-containing protein [Heracleum sosnowskyi]|uniref:GAT domain-containing protein n=1 Tax=Heracleum sosnowskyi TaxID=360622 RepID=A0AAD8LWQ6_9APIA|nr:GAT domain-containing protein [Heracleum sosnowskyi]